MHKTVCLITGATSGLGKNLALLLDQKGFKLILFYRSPKKAKKLKKLFKNNYHEFLEINLVKLNEISKIFWKIKKIDIVINNASYFNTKYENNLDIIKVNYLAPLLIIGEILKKLQIYKTLTVINISSHVHNDYKIENLYSNFENIRQLSSWDKYKLSKLYLTTITLFLSKLKYSKKIYFVSYDPGRMSSNFGSDSPIIIKYLIKIYLKLIGHNPKKISEIIYKKVLKKKIRTGTHMINGKNAMPNIKALDKKFQKKLFFTSKRFLNVNF